jgi:hypothetical protein
MPHQVIRCSRCGEAMEIADILPYGLTYWCPEGDGRAFATYKQLDRMLETKADTLEPYMH